MFACPPSGEALSDKVVELGQRQSSDVPKVVPGTDDVLVQPYDDRFQTLLWSTRPTAYLVAHPRKRFARNVEVRLPHRPPDLMPKEVEALFPHVEHLGFLRVKAQSEPFHELLDPRQFAVWASWCEQYEIIRIADESPVQLLFFRVPSEVSVKQVQVDVR